jgi:hypothetical protein
MLPGSLIINRRDQKLHVWPVASKPMKRSGVVEGILSREGAHFLGCDRCMGNKGLWDSCSNRHLGLGNSIEF